MMQRADSRSQTLDAGLGSVLMVEDNLRVIRRGYTEVHECGTSGLEVGGEAPGTVPMIPLALDVPAAEIANRLKSWKASPCKEKRGTLAKYAKLVSSASEGAITDGD